MAETKLISSLYVVTDSETYYEKIGDIDGGLIDQDWLRKHIINHGSHGLLFKLSSMISSVVEMQYEVMRGQDCFQNIESSNKTAHES